MFDYVADLSPFIDMINIFEVFLPQLLRYPNPNDPLNGEAAALMMRHPKEYETKVRGKHLSHWHLLPHSLHDAHFYSEYVKRFATQDAMESTTDGSDEEADEEMSDIGSISEDEAQES